MLGYNRGSRILFCAYGLRRSKGVCKQLLLGGVHAREAARGQNACAVGGRRNSTLPVSCSCVPVDVRGHFSYLPFGRSASMRAKSC
eukprot:880477-Pleurochrysis_carterae.AAC.3